MIRPNKKTGHRDWRGKRKTDEALLTVLQVMASPHNNASIFTRGGESADQFRKDKHSISLGSLRALKEP